MSLTAWRLPTTEKIGWPAKSVSVSVSVSVSSIDLYNNDTEIMTRFKLTKLIVSNIYPVELDNRNYKTIRSATINFNSALYIDLVMLNLPKLCPA